MGKLLQRDKGAIEKEISDLDVKLATIDPHTQGAEYEQLLKIRSMLVEQADKGWVSRIDPNVVLKLVGTLGVAGMIMVFEAYGHIFTSKASSLMPKIL
jgi:hypothetical protein